MQNRNISTTMAKGLEVLQAFDDTDPELTQAELARRTGLDRATVRRLCLTLVDSGFAIQSSKGFRLSPRVLTLAGSYLRANDIGYSLQPILNDGSLAMGRELSVAVLDGDRALLIAQSQVPDARISFGFTVGSTLPLLPTAIGRMLLSSLSETEQQTLLKQLPIKRYTPSTCDDLEALKVILKRINTAQAAVVTGEFEVEICGIAVPISKNGKAVAVVGTSYPMKTPRFERYTEKAITELRSTARELSELRYFREALERSPE